MNYTIVSKTEVPLDHYSERGKWQKLFSSMPPDKVARFEFTTMSEAQRVRNNLRGCFRGVPFHTRIIGGEDNKCSLFAWLEATKEP